MGVSPQPNGSDSSIGDNSVNSLDDDYLDIEAEDVDIEEEADDMGGDASEDDYPCVLEEFDFEDEIYRHKRSSTFTPLYETKVAPTKNRMTLKGPPFWSEILEPDELMTVGLDRTIDMVVASQKKENIKDVDGIVYFDRVLAKDAAELSKQTTCPSDLVFDNYEDLPRHEARIGDEDKREVLSGRRGLIYDKPVYLAYDKADLEDNEPWEIIFYLMRWDQAMWYFGVAEESPFTNVWF